MFIQNLIHNFFSFFIKTIKLLVSYLFFTIKKSERILPSPSNSTENTKNDSPRLKTHKFENKSLSILERCGVIAYDYDDDNPRAKEIIDFISSEYKIIIKFNSIS